MSFMLLKENTGSGDWTSVVAFHCYVWLPRRQMSVSRLGKFVLLLSVYAIFMSFRDRRFL